MILSRIYTESNPTASPSTAIQSTTPQSASNSGQTPPITVFAQPALVSNSNGQAKDAFIVPVAVPLQANTKGWHSYDIHTNNNGNLEIIPTSRTLICKDTTQTFIDDDEPITCLVFIILFDLYINHTE